MQWCRGSFRFEVSAGSCVLLAALLLFMPIRWVLAWILATAVHEWFHYLALRLFKVPVYSLSVAPYGILMETGFLPPGREFICALAGPVGALSLLLTARIIPAVAVCASIQSVFNLLPVGKLDGGRVLRCFAEAKLPQMLGARLCLFVEIAVIILALAAAAYLTLVLNLGALPFVVAFSLLLRTEGIKIPCKEAQLRVQYRKRNQRGM